MIKSFGSPRESFDPSNTTYRYVGKKASNTRYFVAEISMYMTYITLLKRIYLINVDKNVPLLLFPLLMKTERN
jgi:hypothetical protein